MLIYNKNSQIVKHAHDLFKESKTKTSDWRAEAREDYMFYEGDQWSSEDKMYLEENKRPIVTFNRVAPTIDAVTGSERNNRHETRFLQRTPDDGPPNEMLTGVCRWVRDECDAEDEESDAFQDMLICGVGVTETRIDFDSEKDGQIRIDRIPPLEMYWDWNSYKRNMMDAEWVMRVRMVPKARIKERWPKKRIDWSSGFQLDERQSPHHADSADWYREDQGGKVNVEMGAVADFQWVERRPIYRVNGPEGIEELTESQYRAVKDQIEMQEYQVLRQTRKEYFTATIAGATVLKKSALHAMDEDDIIPGFTYNFMTGKRALESKQWFGLVRPMKDPARWSNKFFSQIQDIINSNAKGGLLAEGDAFEDIRRAEEDWAKPDKIIKMNPGALQNGKVQERGKSSYPQGLDRLMQVAMGATRDVSGVNLEVLGMADRQQAGVVETSRIKQGLTILSTFFDSLRYYRKAQGRIMLHFIRYYIPDKTMVRVVGEERFVEYKRDKAFERYDVIVDQSPTSANMKEEVWKGFQLVLPAMVKAGLPIPPDIIDFVPLPASVITKVKKFYQQKAQQSPEQKKMAMLEMQSKEAEIEKLRAQAMKALADAKGVGESNEISRGANEIKALQALVEALSEDDNERPDRES
ncbi:MAG TPA: hypothetical protein DIT58_01870 [Porticoccaceae bacterium]|nr:hypothetical protein [Porticoccaceae bacterium]